MKDKLIELLKLPADASDDQVVTAVAQLDTEVTRLRPLMPTAREQEICRVMKSGNMTRENAVLVVASREQEEQRRTAKAKSKK